MARRTFKTQSYINRSKQKKNGKLLLQSLYLFSWYYCKRFYFSLYVHRYINRDVHAYFSDNAEVTMELEGIDLMFANKKITPMPINDYREYIKERTNEENKHKR